MKAAELRAIVGRMTDAPWRHGAAEKYNIFVRYADALEGPAIGERVLLKANTNFAYVENMAGIAALRNHAAAWIALQEAGERLDKLSDGEFTRAELDAALDDIIAKLRAIEALP